jgi:hypothetical protein
MTRMSNRTFSQHALAALLALIAGLIVTGTAWAAPESQRWITYLSETAGLHFEYPAGTFSESGGDPTEALQHRTGDRAGRVFTTADGRAQLQIGTFPNLDKVSVSGLRTRAIDAVYKNARLDYNRATENWYVLSGTRGSETFYERSHFSCGGRRIDVWTVTYPTAEARVFDTIVDEMARRFRANLSNIRCN